MARFRWCEVPGRIAFYVRRFVGILPMLRKLLIIWFPAAASAGIAGTMSALSHVVRYHFFRELWGNRHLPAFTVCFVGTPGWAYLFPIPIFLLAMILSFRKKENTDNAILFAVATLSVAFLFVPVWLVAMCLPLVMTPAGMTGGGP